ncbi:HTH-type transcriptional activator RhaR [Pseudomonas sp. Bi70]|uniref:helix-turn-helix domain-containing protein n=1 Tax=Pseudomonas sp. Bi70 TaxID=2821127 RepID=UPI001D85D934|nr:AraC family transcriptional regulator [Pseudomonas sp. Bi70]CAH0201327.1 HTH-type transcriptional activator RhaR [Pseudomonas sp. Bi70]
MKTIQGSAHSPTSASKLADWQEDIAKQLMLANLDAGISVAEVAEACALSRSHFTRKFKESTLLSPHVWLRQQRVDKAMALLRHSPLSLTQVAMECGFFDQAHFCRVFARSQGMTPLAFKRQQQGQPVDLPRVAC